MSISYKGVNLNSIYHGGNEIGLGKYKFLKSSGDFDRNLPTGIKVGASDISNLASARIIDYGVGGNQKVDLGGINYKHISAVGWGGGGGGGGNGGKGYKCCCGSGRSNGGGGGAGGGNGGYFKIRRYPLPKLKDSTITISVGGGGANGNHGGNHNNCNGGKGGDGGGGGPGGDTNIHVDGTHIAWAQGGGGGGAGNAGTSGGGGNNGGAGGTGGTNYASGYSYSNLSGGLGQNSGWAGGVATAGTGGYCRIYLHYE
jgi:hypothetical protein